MERISTIADRIIQIGFILLAFLVPLIMTPWNYELFEYNKMTMAYGITAVIMFAWVSKMIAQKRLFIARTPFDIPIGLFVLSQFISTLFSMDPIVSWFGYYSRFNGGMLSVLCYTLLFYTYVSNIQKEFGKKLLFALLGSATIVAIYGVLQHFGIDKHIWVQDVQARVFSTLGQPNWLAAYLVALAPLAWAIILLLNTDKWPKTNILIYSSCIIFHCLEIALFCILILLYNKPLSVPAVVFTIDIVFWILVFFRKIPWKVLRSLCIICHVALVIVIFTTLLFTKSRSGLAAFAVVDVLFWTLLFILSSRTSESAIRDPSATKHWMLKQVQHDKIKIFVICHVAFIICIFIFGTGIPKIDNFIKQNPPTPQTAPVVSGPVLESGGTESGVIRKYVWEGAMNAWKATPKNMLIGTGTETFAFAFYKYKPIGHNNTSEWDFLYNKAHNEYLNFLATTGIFGLGSYLFLIGSIIYWFIKNLNSNFFILNLAFFCSWISLLITNFFGFSVVVTQLLFFLMPATAYVYHVSRIKYQEKKLSLTKKAQILFLIIMFLILDTCIVTLGIFWYADKTFATGYRLSRAGQYAKAYLPLRDSVGLNSFIPLYHDEYAVVLSSLALGAFESQDATLAGTLAVYSLTENDNALRLSPQNVNFWKSRTKIFYALATIDVSYLPQAIDALLHAQTLSPNDPKIVYNLAILYGKLGDTDKAVTNLLEAKRLKPNYKDAYYALFIFYKETKQQALAKAIIEEYLSTIDSRDSEFIKLVE